MRRVDLGINNPILESARMGFDECLKMAVNRATRTGSLEGSATLKVGFQLKEAIDAETGETYLAPSIQFKAGYTVPMKDSIDGKIIEASRIFKGPEGEWLLVNNQITMDELLAEEDEGEKTQ